MMTKRGDRTDPKARISPVATLSHISDDFVAELNIPPLPESVPQRLADAVERRVQALLFHLREAYRAVLTAYELNLPDCEAHYATFRQLVEELGYERVEVGFAKPEK